MKRLILSITILLFPAFLASAQVEDTLIEAVTLFGDEKIDAAKDSLVSVIQRDSTVDAAYYYLGLVHYAQRDVQSALDCFNKAVSLDPDNEWYKESLASLFSETGNNPAATQIYLDLLQKNPKRYRNHYTLTLLADQTLAQGDDSLAVEYYNQALMYEPDYIPARLGLADARRMQDKPAEFFAIITSIVAESNIMESPKENLLTSIFRSLHPEEWMQCKKLIYDLIDALKSAHPAGVEGFNAAMYAASVHHVYDDTAACISDVMTILKMDGIDAQNTVRALNYLGDLYHEAGDEKLCFDMYDMALRIDPSCASVLNNYAYFLCEKGKKLGKAYRMAKKAVEAEPDNATYLDTIGWILYLQGKPAKAKPYFKHAMIYGGKESDVVLYHYSRVLEALGENKLADFYRMQIKNK